MSLFKKLLLHLDCWLVAFLTVIHVLTSGKFSESVSFLLIPLACGVCVSINIDESLSCLLVFCFSFYNIHPHTGCFAGNKFLVFPVVSLIACCSDWNAAFNHKQKLYLKVNVFNIVVFVLVQSQSCLWAPCLTSLESSGMSTTRPVGQNWPARDSNLVKPARNLTKNSKKTLICF